MGWNGPLSWDGLDSRHEMERTLVMGWGLSLDGSSRTTTLTRRLVAYQVESCPGMAARFVMGKVGLSSRDGLGSCRGMGWTLATGSLDPCHGMGSALVMGWNGLLSWDGVDPRHGDRVNSCPGMGWTLAMGQAGLSPWDGMDPCHGMGWALVMRWNELLSWDGPVSGWKQ